MTVETDELTYVQVVVLWMMVWGLLLHLWLTWQMLVRQKHSKEGSSATNSASNTARGRTSLGLRPWQQPVPLPSSTLDSLVRTKSLAGSPHGAGFGEISTSQEEAVLTKDKEEVGEFGMEKIIVEDEGIGFREDQSKEKKSSFWQDLCLDDRLGCYVLA